LKTTNWFFLFVLAAIVGIAAGYFVTLMVRPTLLPPSWRLGGLREPTTVMFLGTDVVYTRSGARNKADLSAFTGRSDTIMVARLDPIRNTLSVISIPRDTQVYIPGYGHQKINAANALGGPLLARRTVSEFLGVPIDHYVVLNVHGLVRLVDELGGITVEIPKRMRYMDWTAKLKIDLEPGPHTLTGNQAMGFVRFRHDALGDIGRVQRQEIFMRAVLDRALQPESWAKIPQLVTLGHEYVASDISDPEILGMLGFMRAVPKQNQKLVMLPGQFSADGLGNWSTDPSEVSALVARLFNSQEIANTKDNIRVAIENASSHNDLGGRLAKVLRARGYSVIMVKDAEEGAQLNGRRTRIIAQKGNPDDARMVRMDLSDHGDIVTASIGDIESSVTIIAGDDLDSVLNNTSATQVR